MMHEWRMVYKLCPFYSISVISGRWDADNERLCAMEPSYWSERFPPLAGFGPETARAAGQGYTYWATGLPKVFEAYVHTGSNLKVLIHSVYSILRHVKNRCLPKRVPFPG